jgi:hypothetical protein
MQWPKVDPRKSICEIEEELGISDTDERNDIRPTDLGNHPSKSYYSGPEPDFDAMRSKFDQVAKKYD